MSKSLGYRVNVNIKSDYDKLIAEKYGHQRNRCGKSIEKLMKLELALEGNDSYQDDPDVMAMLGKLRKMNVAHTHSVVAVKESVKESMEEKIHKVIDDIVDAKVKEKIKGEAAKKVGSLAVFKKNFQMEYNGYTQVSRRDITRFIMNNDGVYDSRAIQNRIEYLLAQEVIEPFAQNVYNLKF